MLLVQMTIGGVVHYISDEFLDIEHFYEAQVAGLSSLRIATAQPYGGYAAPTYGDIDLLPDLFAANWPPPATCVIKIMIGDAGEAGAYLVFEGTAYLQEVGRDGVTYQLYGKPYDTNTSDATYQGTLNQVFAAACAVLGLTLNSTYARVSSPSVDYHSDGTKALIDDLSDIASFFSHRFYVEGTTLSLVDCLRDNGAVLALTEFDVFPSSYTTGDPVKMLKATYPGLPTMYGIRVWRTQVSTNHASIAEVAFRATSGGANLAITASGASSNNGTNTHDKARDGNNATRWESTNNIDFSSPASWWGTIGGQIALEFDLTAPATSDLGQTPIKFDLIGYDGNTSQWRTIHQHETSADWTEYQLRTFSAEQPTWDATVAGSHTFGNDMDIAPACSTAYSNIITALTDIKTMLERSRVQISLPLSAALPKIGQKITLTDESLYQSTSIWARVSALVIDFDNNQCVIEGEGALA